MAATVIKKRTVDMTEGSILSHLIKFSIPLIVGNFFQLFYNLVDAWTVGNFVSNAAFSAIGTVAPVVNMLVGFFGGLATGAGVVISQYYGAGDYEKVSKAVHTSLILTAVMGILLTVVGVLIVPYSLEWMNTPEETYHDAKSYLTISFLGVTGLIVYNMGAGILRAIGDSKRPFYYLVVSTVINVVLDLVFVLGFNMGVEGVAYATIIAQAVSAILVVLTLIFTKTCVKINIKNFVPDFKILSKVIIIGIPTALQMAITAISNVFVQSYINYFGTDAMSGYTAYIKVDNILWLVPQSIGLATTTFVGQNLGKGDAQRAKSGIYTALWLSLLVTATLIVPIVVFAPALVAFFNNAPAVIEYGTLILRWVTPFAITTSVNIVIAGAMNGAGKTRASMIITLVSFVAFRQIYLFVVANFISNTFMPIIFGYPAGWIVRSVLLLIYFSRMKMDSIIEKREKPQVNVNN